MDIGARSGIEWAGVASSIPGSPSDPPSGPKGRIKGAALAEFLAWYQLENGQEAILDSLAVCDLKFQGTFTPTQNTFGVLASRWYAAEAVHCVLDEITRRHT